MAKYMVTAAVMQVPGSTAAGDPAWVYAYRGAVVDLDPDSDAVKHHLDLEMIEKLADVEDDPTVAAGGGPLASAPVMAVRPADDADKPEWVAFAVRSGLAQSDAELASRDDLVAIFSGGEGLSESADVDPMPEMEGGEASRPPLTAKKDVWVDYRESQGVPRDEAEAMTKEQLQDDGAFPAQS